MNRTGYRRAAPVAVFAVLVLVGSIGVTGRPMGNDESASRWAALLGLRQLHHLLGHVDAVHGLYYLLLHAWAWFGTSPGTLRIPSVVAMAAAGAVVTTLGIRLTGRITAGVLAGLLMAATPSVSYYAQTARSYALVFLVVAAATWQFVRALEAPTWRRWIGYAALIALAGWLNELAVLVLLAHGTTMLVLRPSRQRIVRWGAAALVSVAAVAPLIAVSSGQQAALTLSRPDLSTLRGLVATYAGPSVIVTILVLTCAVLAIVGVPGSAPSQAEPGRSPSTAQLCIPLIVLPAGVLFVESLVHTALYADRYVLWGEFGVALLAADGLDQLTRTLRPVAVRIVPLAAALAVVALVQLSAQSFIRTAGSRLYDFGRPAHYVAAHARAGDGVLFDTAFFRKIRLGYADCFAHVDDVAVAVSPAAAGSFSGTLHPPRTVATLMVEHNRLWVLGKFPRPMPNGGPFSTEQRTLTAHFSLVRRVRFHGITVSLWQLRTAPAAVGA